MNQSTRIAIPWWHLMPNESFKKQYTIPDGHPNVDTMFLTMGQGADAINNMHAYHPNITAIMTKKGYSNKTLNATPTYHPNLDSFVVRDATPVFTIMPTPWWHPNVNASFMKGERLPTSHPTILFPQLPSNHPDVNMLLAKPNASSLPSYHPYVDQWIALDARPAPVKIAVPFWPPDVNLSYSLGPN